MQASAQGLRSLRRVIRHWMHRKGIRRDPQLVAGTKLAYELGLPAEAVTRILDQISFELRKLSFADGHADARPIIERAVEELGKLGLHTRPFEEEAVDRYLHKLSNRDYLILRYFKEGKKHHEIAELIGSNVDLVRRSLVQTYAELRIKMTSAHHRAMQAQTASIKKLKQTSLPH